MAQHRICEEQGSGVRAHLEEQVPLQGLVRPLCRRCDCHDVVRQRLVGGAQRCDGSRPGRGGTQHVLCQHVDGRRPGGVPRQGPAGHLNEQHQAGNGLVWGAWVERPRLRCCSMVRAAIG